MSRTNLAAVMREMDRMISEANRLDARRRILIDQLELLRTQAVADLMARGFKTGTRWRCGQRLIEMISLQSLDLALLGDLVLRDPKSPSDLQQVPLARDQRIDLTPPA